LEVAAMDSTTRRRWLPNSTQIPDHFLDFVMQDLTESELKVALYVLRRTFGFQKDGDRISLSQLVDGITRRDGRQLDRGTGLARSSVVRGIKGLEGRGLLQVHRSPGTKQNAPETTYYSLTIEDVEDSPKLQPPQSQIESGDSARLSPGAVPNSNGQNPDQKQEPKDLDDQIIRRAARQHGLLVPTARRLADEHRDPDGTLRRVEFEGRCYTVASLARELGKSAR
jgi:hypothetical protein